MKQLFVLSVSLLAISACAPQPAPPPPAVAQPAGTPAPGSPSNTTRAFDGNYANAIARNVTGCPDFCYRSRFGHSQRSCDLPERSSCDGNS